MSSKWVRVIQAVILVVLAADVGYWLYVFDSAIRTASAEAEKSEFSAGAMVGVGFGASIASNVSTMKIVGHTVIAGALIMFVGLFKKDVPAETANAGQPSATKVEKPVQAFRSVERVRTEPIGGWG